MDLDAAAFGIKDEHAQKLLKGVEDLHTYVERNQAFIPNTGNAIAMEKRSLQGSWNRQSIKCSASGW
jgi:hypothetical protein